MHRIVWLFAALLAASACKKPTAPSQPTQPSSAAQPAQGTTSPSPVAKAAASPGDWRKMLRSPDPGARRQAIEAMPAAQTTEPPAVLLEALKDADEGVRKAAIGVTLGFIFRYAGAAAIPALLALGEKDPSRDVRADAIRAVGNSSHHDVVPRLVALFAVEKDDAIRAQVLAILARSGDRRALPILTGLLKEAEPPQAAIEGIRLIERKASPELLKLLEHPSAKVRSRAAAVLGEIGDAAALPKLREALGAREPQVVQAAADSLAMLGGPEALAGLVQLAGHADVNLQAVALRALANFREPTALLGAPVLATLLQHLERGAPESRVAAAQALGSARAKQAVAALRKIAAAKNPTPVRIAALEALGHVGGAGALSTLAASLRDSDEQVRTSAALTLGRMDAAGRPAAAALMAAWRRKDAQLDFKAEILTALGRIGAVKAAPLLRRVATSDPVSLLKVLAAGALLRLERPEGIEAIRPLLTGASQWQERREAARILEARSWQERRSAAKSATGQKFAGAVAQLILDALATEKESLVREALYTQLARARGPIAARAQRRALSEPVPFFRLMAAAGLCRNGDAKGCEVVVAGLTHPEAAVRTEAARRAGWYRVTQAREALQSMVKDPVVAVATAARDALGRL